MERDLLNREIKSLGVGIDTFPMQSMEFETKEPPIVEDPNTLVPEAAIMPFSKVDRECIYVGLLNAVDSRNAIKKNLAAYKKYGVDKINIIRALNSYVDVGVLEVIMTNNLTNFTINEEMVLAETIHQFQAKIFSDSKQWDGIIGPFVLSSLGFVFHNNKVFNEYNGYYKVKNLYKKHVLLDAIEKYKLKLNMPLLENITGKNWFNYIINPSIFGWNGNKGHGFHLLLILELRKAEKILYTQLQAELITEFKQNINGKMYTPYYTQIQKPHYFLSGGSVPRILGKVLGIKQQHSDTRMTPGGGAPMSIHLSGLALDINYNSNPWVKGEKGLDVLKTAAPKVVITKTKTAQVYFKEVAIKNNNKTDLIYDELTSINNLCKSYHAGFKPNKTINWGGSRRSNKECFGGFLDLKKELVVTLREKIGMAWLAVDIGTEGEGNGDMMHFDMRTSLIGLAYFKALEDKKIAQKSTRQIYLESIGWKFEDI